MKETNELLLGESDYGELLKQAVAVLNHARIKIAIQACNTISNAYWHLGRLLKERKLESRHGSGVVKRLSVDLKQQFPEIGVSPRNLWEMKRFYIRYESADAKLQQAVAFLPWGQTDRCGRVPVSTPQRRTHADRLLGNEVDEQVNTVFSYLYFHETRLL